MKKYLLQSKKAEGDVICGYNEDDLLVYFEIKEGVSKLQIIWMLSVLPPRHNDFLQLKEQLGKRGTRVVEMIEDLSFDSFWVAYNYKKGKKKKVREIWESMPDSQRVKSLAYISRYNHYLSTHSHVQRLYPQGYLTREEWNN